MHFSNCGIYINRDYPIFDALPDGHTDTHVTEVSIQRKNCFKLSKVQWENLKRISIYSHSVANVIGYFCVASPDFVKTCNFQLIEVCYDAAFMINIMKEAEYFWRTVIFTHFTQ